MCWHVYYYDIFVAQFVYESHAKDFQKYNRHCTVVQREEIPKKNLYTDRFSIIDIEFTLRIALQKDGL